MNRQNNRFILGLVVCSFIFIRFFFVVAPDLSQSWELKARDFLSGIKNSYFKENINTSIIHIDIDDATLAEIPYSVNDKELYTHILNILGQAGVSSALFDMLFPKCAYDNACNEFIDAIINFKNVYAPIILNMADKQIVPSEDDYQNLPKNEFIWTPALKSSGKTPSYKKAFTNFPEMDQSARGIGHINIYPDLDGVFRKIPLLLSYEKGFVPLASFRMVCDFLNVTPDRIEGDLSRNILLRNAHFPDGRKKDISIPVDSEGYMIINFAGTWDDSFPHYSVSQLFEIEKDENLMELLLDDIEGSLAIISDISTGSRDVGPIPLENYYPLSGLHANTINAILEQSFIKTANPIVGLIYDLILIVFLVFSAIRFKGVRFGLIAIAILLLFDFYVVTVFLVDKTVIAVVRTSLGIIFALSSVTLYKFMLEEKEKAFVQAKFENYFAPELLDKILKSPEQLKKVEKKNLTVLFSDIAGFTKWSSTRSPEEIHRCLNEYFDEMAEIVFKYGGTIDKYIGDGLLAFFGDPVEYKDHVKRGVSAALEMQERVRYLRKKWADGNIMDIQIRIGINTGEVVVGNLGSEKRLDYTVIGANVNLAQRLESNAPIGGILITHAVREELDESFNIEKREAISAKGFSEKIEVFEVCGRYQK